MRVPKQITNRLNGRFTNEIKRLGKVIEVLKTEKTRGEYEFLDLCIEVAVQRRNMMIANYFFGKYCSRTKFNNSQSELIKHCIKEDKIVIRGIRLPLPKEGDYSIVGGMAISTLFSVILNDFKSSEEYYINESPYEYGENVRLCKGDIVIDAGANIGEFSALAVYKGCVAYAFEPMDFIINDYLSKTVELNPGIVLAPFALYDEEKTLEFKLDKEDIGASSSEKYSSSKSEKVIAKAIPLDTYVDRNNIQKIDFIKADIEGAERKMLMGASGVLKDFAPKLSLCTYHLPDDPEVMRDIILSTNPNYKITQDINKMYCYV